MEMTRDSLEKLEVPPSAEALKYMPLGSVMRCVDKEVSATSVHGMNQPYLWQRGAQLMKLSPYKIITL
jgi:hypothetical protein